MEVKLVIKTEGAKQSVLALQKIKKELDNVSASSKKASAATKAASRSFSTASKNAAKLAKSNKSVSDSNKKVSKTSKKAKKDVNSLADTMRFLRNSLLAVASVRFAAGLINQFTDVVNSALNMEAQLRAVISPLDDVDDVFTALSQSADRAGVSIDSQVELYARLKRATNELGVSQQTLFDLVENISGAFVVSGATAQETRNAMIQLAQGFSAGALRGDEFRSVMEQAPELIEALKNSLGVTQGELIKMAFAGELTSEKLVEAFREIPGLAEKIEQLPLTTERAMARFNNQVQSYVRESTVAKGVNDLLAKSVINVADNFDVLVNTSIAGVIVGIGLLANALRTKLLTALLTTDGAALKLRATLKSLGKASLATLAISAAITLFDRMTSSINKAREEAEKLPDVFDGVSDVIARIKQLNNTADFSQASEVATIAYERQKKAIDDLIAQRDELQAHYNELRKEPYSAVAGSVSILKERIEILNNKISEATKKTSEFVAEAAKIGVLPENLSPVQEFFAKFIQDAIKLKEAQLAQAKAEDEARKAREQSIKDGEKLIEQIRKRVSNLELERAKVVEGTQAYRELLVQKTLVGIVDKKQAEEIKKLLKQQFKLTDEIKKANEAKKKSAKNTKVETKETKDFTGVLKYLNEQQQEYIKTLDKIAKARQKMSDKLRVMIDDLQREIEISQAVGDEKLRLEALYELERSGIDTTDESLHGLIERYIEFYKQQQKISNDNTIFSYLDRLKKSFDDLFSGDGKLGDRIEKFAKEINNVVNFANDAVSAFEKNKGKDALGQYYSTINDLAAQGYFGQQAQAVAGVLEGINQLFGGKLFGTAFETVSESINAAINASGIGGNRTTTQERERSFFRGTETRQIVNQLSNDVIQFLDSVFRKIEQTIRQIGRDFSTQAQFVQGQFTQTVDAEGNVTSSVSRINGRTFNDPDLQAFGQRLLAENIIAALGGVFGQVEAEVTNYTAVWEREFGGAIGQIGTTTTQLVDEVQLVAERWRDNADLLLEGARFLQEAARRFASGENIVSNITDLTNVVEELSRANETLSQTYQRLIDSAEVVQVLFDNVDARFELAGTELFRFGDGLVTAFGGLSDAQSNVDRFLQAFYSGIDGLRRQSELAAQESLAMLLSIGLAADTTIEQFTQAFNASLPSLSPHELAIWIRVGNAMQDAADAADRLTQSLVAQARQIIQMRRQLQRMAYDLFGSATNLDEINQQIALLEQQQQNQIVNTSNAATDMFSRWQDALESMQQYLDGLLLDSDLSPLSPQQQLDEALSQFDALVAAAQGGDIDAFNQLQQLATVILNLGRDIEASGADYNAIFNYVTSTLAGITNPASQTPTGGQQTVELVPSDELRALYEQRDALEAEQLMRDVFDFADTIRQYIELTGLTLDEVLTDLNVSLEDIAGALGVELGDLNADMGRRLAQLANVLGIELSDLTDRLNVDLGQLSDATSLLNDTFESVISQLPQGIREQLEPLLEAVENAPDADARQAALDALINETASLPVEYRNLLAPFFDEIDATSEIEQQLILLEAQNDILLQIYDAIVDAPPPPQAPPEQPAPTGTPDSPINVTTPEPIIVSAPEPIIIDDSGNYSTDLLRILLDEIRANGAITVEQMERIVANTGDTAQAAQENVNQTINVASQIEQLNETGVNVN